MRSFDASLVVSGVRPRRRSRRGWWLLAMAIKGAILVAMIWAGVRP